MAGWMVQDLRAMSTTTLGTPRALQMDWGTSVADAGDVGAKSL